MAKQEKELLDVFCAKCQQITPHEEEVDQSDEYIYTCQTCHGFIKLPKGMSEDERAAKLVEHKEVNQGKEVFVEPETHEEATTEE